MAKKTLKEGSTLAVPNDIGVGVGAIPAGAKLTFEGKVPSGELGGGPEDEETYLFTFEEGQTRAFTDRAGETYDSKPITRRISLTADQLADLEEV